MHTLYNDIIITQYTGYRMRFEDFKFQDFTILRDFRISSKISRFQRRFQLKCTIFQVWCIPLGKKHRYVRSRRLWPCGPSLRVQQWRSHSAQTGVRMLAPAQDREIRARLAIAVLYDPKGAGHETTTRPMPHLFLSTFELSHHDQKTRGKEETRQPSRSRSRSYRV